MKLKCLRRLGALALAFALSLPLAVVPAMAYVGSVTGLTISADGKDIAGDPPAITMKVGESATLSVKPTDAADTQTYQYNWGTVPEGEGEIEFSDQQEHASSRTIKATKAGGIGLTVMTPQKDPDDEGSNLGVYLSLKIIEDTPPEPSVTVETITLNETELTLEIGKTAALSAIPVPAGSHMGEVSWSSTNPACASVDQDSGVVTANKATPEGSPAVITATTKNKNGEDVTASCKVVVPEKAVYATGLVFSPNSVRIDPADGGSKRVSVNVTPSSTCNQVVEWDTSKTDPDVIKVEAVAMGNAYNRQVLLREVGPGETTVTAKIKEGADSYKEATLTVTVSGLKILNPPGRLTENQGYQLQYEDFGLAKSAMGTVTWASSDDATVAVNSRSGYITALKPGTVTITVTKGAYKATCRVTVEEDTSSIVNVPGPFNAGKPLVMSTISGELNNISLVKTEIKDAEGNIVTPASPLSYISNVSVPTAQGTLYYNYNSEANTGDGVGIGDRFYRGSAPAGWATLGQLTFVPRQGFSGTAEITFNGVSASNNNFSGMIRVAVNGTGDGSAIYYGAISGQPTAFQADDFNAYCLAATGRNLNYVTFTLPSANEGTLYYNYTGPSQYTNRVAAGTQYSRTGSTNINNVSFVPNQGFVGSVSIGFRGVNAAGTTFTGTVEITVGSSSSGVDSADVSFTALDGKQAALRAGDFNDACRGVLGDNLSYVRFQLPAANEGVLYYNYRGAGSYDSRVDPSTRYYYSGTPGIGNITFVAAANVSGQVAIPYTGYSANGATYTGTVYINLQNESQQTIRYFVDKNGLVALQVNDFNNICLQQTGYSMDYVRFAAPTSTASGNPGDLLYYNYRSNVTRNTRVTSGTNYYRAYDSRYSSRYLLGNITFLGGKSARTVTIPYTMYANTNTSANGGTRIVNGTMVIQVGAPTPADITLSGSTASPVWLSSYTVRNVCNAVMDNDLSYIEITSVPDKKAGRVYSGYNGVGTGTEVKTGTKYYRMGSPSIDQLSFVPYGGFNGTATITYVGYSSNGREQVSGQIKITIANSTTSRYFTDMRNHAWAADAVDFMYANNISNGVGGGRYAPASKLTRGDFTLMLIRTFGFTSSSIYRYNDVPSSSYYAQAISTAKIMGITVGDSGKNFYPKRAITRQDAMVMLYNALEASGKTMTNGLAADLTGFSDRDSIAGYARNAIGALVQMGVVKGDGNGRLRPTGTLTRAETAILLQYVLTL